VLAVRLGASNEDIGLLSSIPALLAILISIPTGRFLQSRAHKKPWILWSLSIHRTGYLLLALLPLLKFFNLPVGPLAVWLLILISIPAQFFNIGFIPLLAETIPEERRATVFTARNIVVSVMTSLLTALAGLWLQQVFYPVNYQIMYAFCFGASMLSQYFLVKLNINEAPPVAAPPPAPHRRPLAERLNSFWQPFTGQPAFTRIVRNTFLHGMGIWMAAPLYVLFFVKSLGANEAWIGLNGTIASLATIFGYMFWRWAIARWGEPPILKFTILWAGCTALLVGLLGNLTLILLVTAVNGLVTPGLNLSHFNTFLKIIPPARRPEYHALYSTIMNVGAFISPLISVALAAVIGLGPTLVVCGCLCILGSTSFWWWPVRPEALA
jgi:MFS family permease